MSAAKTVSTSRFVSVLPQFLATKRSFCGHRAAHRSDHCSRFAWSQTSGPGINGEAHARESCARIAAGPRPAGHIPALPSKSYPSQRRSAARRSSAVRYLRQERLITGARCSLSAALDGCGLFKPLDEGELVYSSGVLGEQIAHVW